MTTFETTASTVAPADRRTALVDHLREGVPYAVVLGGQGAPWLESLADLVRDFALEAELEQLVQQAEELLAPVAPHLLRTGADVTPLAWADVLAVGESAEDDDATQPPSAEALAAPVASVPGILLTQLAGLRALRRQGLDTQTARPTAVAGHSQGVLAVAALDGLGDPGLDDMRLYAYARLIGAAAQIVGRRRGLLGETMVSITGEQPERVAQVLADLPASARVVTHLRNGRRAVVLSGPEAGLRRAVTLLEERAEAEKIERERKTTGGSAFAPVIEPVVSGLAFHHPDLAEAADLVAEWAAEAGLDAERGRSLTMRSIVDPVDWVQTLEETLDSGAAWLLDVGPGDLAARMSAAEARVRGVGVVAAATRRGHRELTTPGAAPRRPAPWSSFAPAVVTLPDGTVRAETRFTRLTGRSPVLLAGMTPTTVDAQIVAAAANAGFWAELAGGGQVSEQIFTDRVAELDDLLESGRTYAFNSLFLDPYLWKLQVGGQRLVQKARATGAAIDAVIVTAGIPERDEAVALVQELRDAGIEHTVFKPGTVKQIKQVLAIADDVAPHPVIVQIEGGKAGGHHSWEDLDELLIGSYADLRARDNVVVCVGGGIGTPQAAASYLTGDWARSYGHPVMPLDGVLVGTAAMAALEATTSPQVKQLLVDTPGTPDWVGAGTAEGGMASGRSQLGADIHEIDNTASRTGRLLDEVAGDADAVAERREEIIEALDRTAKPYFGDVEQMTYAQWLGRFVELAYGHTSITGHDEDHSVGEDWLDVTLRDRFHAMLQRAEARLVEADHGTVSTKFPDADSVEDGPAALASLLEAYPHAADVVLHPADVPFFIQVCRRAGKPVNFVPVIDADVRRWWRSDSLWQAHDARYGAEDVCVIPGTVSVAGITRADEPVAELLQRFEDAAVDSVLASGRAPLQVPGRRRTDDVADAVSLVLASPDAVWAGRTVRNPVHRLGDGWVLVDGQRAEHPETGATLTAVATDRADLVVSLTADRTLTLPLSVGSHVADGGVPVVEADAAAAAMLELLSAAAGGSLPVVQDGRARVDATWTPDLAADHAGVTAAEDIHAVPDAFVGLAWPAVFAVIADARTEPGEAVVEGMLDLVHLDHVVDAVRPLDGTRGGAGSGAADGTDLEVTASLSGVEATELGRVVTVDVAFADDSGDVLRLTERFCVRGRPGTSAVSDPARAGDTLQDPRETPRRARASATLAAPSDLHAFAEVSGDHNPIHTSTAAARLAGLGDTIVHGMWLSGAAQHVVASQTGRRLLGWTARWLSPLLPGASVEIRADRVALEAGDEVLDVTCRADGELVMSATARLAAPRTVYAFPGQGIQHAGMGMAGYQRSKAAREVWDRADAHTREALGFSILTVVRDNPTVLVAHGTTHKHPDGVLFLTQFTQVAMAVLGAAQMAELRESGAFVEGSILAGHSVGEYNALAAVSGVIPLEAVVEVVFQRGSVMHTLVPRDAEGRSDYRLAAIRPSQVGLADDEVLGYVERIAEQSGEFLQIVNYNLRGSQYAIAGTVRALEVLEADIAERRDRFGGKAAFILVPGIDVPFHSRVLHGGVPDFRARLEELLPAEIDPTILEGRYVPNLVPRPFTLAREFVAEINELVGPAQDGTGPLEAVLADYDAWAARPSALCRTLLVELLAWQFASPVRWIETQDLMFAAESEGGLGVERFVEVGVGQAPTVANLASSTLKLPAIRRLLDQDVEVLNIERDAGAVFATDEDPAPVEDEAPETPAAEPAEAAPAAPAAAPTAAAGAPRPADLSFDAADGTKTLIAWWTKLRPDQIGAADSIESLCDGASSRRNQLLVDLGGELNLGAIDGAADADVPTLSTQVTGLARGYKPFGPVLTSTFADHFKKLLGPTGRKQSSVIERVTDMWQLGPGWGSHVLAELALGTRDGASVRGGDLATIPIPGSGADVDAAIDAAVQSVAARHGVSVDLPATGGSDATVDAAALAEITGEITGEDGVLASTARHLLSRLGLDQAADGSGGGAGTGAPDSADARVLERVENELGPDWVDLTAPAFDERRALLVDDRWATAREDVARIALGGGADAESVTAGAVFAGAGEAVAQQAGWWAARTEGDVAERLSTIAAEAVDQTPGVWADDVAVVTGASKGSIAASVVAGLLAGGATVVATTSRLDRDRLRFYRQLYRSNARPGARLWVVPANMASYTDVDALAEWITTEQSRTIGSTKHVSKPALTPTLLLPFAAGRVMGDLTDAGSRAEVDTRILLWSVERLIGRLAARGRDHDLAASLHVVLPGSPNRGMFGGDGAYGEAKAALDAIVTKWSAERTWADRVTLAHAIIGWVKGTGLMGGNDPLVEAVEAAGVQTWTTDEMAEQLLQVSTAAARESAAEKPLTADFTGGLAGADLDLAALAATVERPERAAEDEPGGIAALAPSPAQLPQTVTPEWGEVTARPEDLVVVVGSGELGPYGSARTRFEMEVHDELSAAGVLELAWSTGLITWDEQNGSWYDVESDEPVQESEIHERYHDVVVERCGIRRYEDDGSMVDNSAPLLTSVYLDEDLTFSVGSEAEARAMVEADPERTVATPVGEGEWTVTRKAGTEIRVPRRMSLSRTVGGQIPTGFDPSVWGIPAEMLESVDRVAIWNLVSTVDAFLSSGFTPSELMRWVHPAFVANTQGTGMGGMSSMHALYINTLLGESNPNDILQEALPNVIAAHVVQSYVGSYGAMIHPVAACATTAVSVEEGVDKIKVGKAEFVVAGGFDDLSTEGIIGFADMSATADTGAMTAQGIDERYVSRANDRRRGGFVESQGGGTLLLARGDVAARMGLPVHAVVAFAASYADGVHTSIPAPGIGALAAGIGGEQSMLARSLSSLGLSADDIGVVSKHDTSTDANDPNESELHERLAAALGRSEGNPLFVVSQKTLTGHAKGGAAAFQLIGLCQVLGSGVLPPNRSLDCVDDALAENQHLVWLREPLATPGLKAGLVTSLGFGHVAGIIALAHPEAFVASLDEQARETYLTASRERVVEGRLRLARTMVGGAPAYERPADRRLGSGSNGTARSLEASVLLDRGARLSEDGVYACR
ncbi:fatty acid synthase subunit beta domain-containing protein [Aeromicrobium sp. CTD01-1L150]|uniref:fatty acid synthase subunit beta domain-containing protein n=1 Tax=Aeromicrobium sp. CTD01-1L150 TaxID=3341830 RepID=UPI0035BEF012